MSRIEAMAGHRVPCPLFSAALREVPSLLPESVDAPEPGAALARPGFSPYNRARSAGPEVVRPGRTIGDVPGAAPETTRPAPERPREQQTCEPR
jgi:hypothetical protein